MVFGFRKTATAVVGPEIEEEEEQIMWREWGRIKVCTGCWWGSLRERGHWEDQGLDGRIILR
jgi:hypothetical protein